MTKRKLLVVVGSYIFLVLAVSACCDEGFHYKWHSIILQRYSDGEFTEETTLSQDGFRLRAHLISIKSNEANFYVPKLIDRAYANNCNGNYLNADIVEDVDVVLVTEENGLTTENVVTYLFDASLSTNSGNKIQVFDLPATLNSESSKYIEYIDFTLKESFEKEIIGQFMIIFRLKDDRFLSDITETLTLKL